MDDVSALLEGMEAALDDADATLSTILGDDEEVTQARLWHAQVLVDWEPDPQAGGCLLRPSLLRRLIALGATTTQSRDVLELTASGRVVAGLGLDHAGLVQRLGGARRVELHVRLRFSGAEYRGGDETYFVLEHGKRAAVVKVNVDVRIRTPRGASPDTSRSAR